MNEGLLIFVQTALLGCWVFFVRGMIQYHAQVSALFLKKLVMVLFSMNSGCYLDKRLEYLPIQIRKLWYYSWSVLECGR